MVTVPPSSRKLKDSLQSTETGSTGSNRPFFALLAWAKPRAHPRSTVNPNSSANAGQRKRKQCMAPPPSTEVDFGSIVAIAGGGSC